MAYPSIDILDNDDDRLLDACILTKAKFWKYEEEYRIVSLEPNQPNTLPVKNNVYCFPEELLIGVIFGCNMIESDRNWIIKLLKKRLGQIQLMEAKKNKYNYSLDIVDL